MPTIRYSVIIPHKDIPDLLNRLLRSIPKREDIEVFVVNDNSDPNKKNPISRISKKKMTKYLLYALLLYLAAINIFAFFLYGIDKWKARHDKWRVTEARLLSVALLGGSVGAFLGMKIWHHKTQHAKFKYGLPLILCLHLAIAIVAVYYFYFYR